MEIKSLMLIACSCLLLSACRDEHVLAEDVVESHFNIPCERLSFMRLFWLAGGSRLRTGRDVMYMRVCICPSIVRITVR